MALGEGGTGIITEREMADRVVKLAMKKMEFGGNATEELANDIRCAIQKCTTVPPLDTEIVSEIRVKTEELNALIKTATTEHKMAVIWSSSFLTAWEGESRLELDITKKL